MTHFLDERTLQRCLDGELSEDEQHALLRQLDRSPDSWRVVALAFFEHQLWTQAGRDFVHEPPSPHVAPSDPEPETRRDHSWLRHTLLAACTLMAVGLGYFGGTQRYWPGRSAPGSSPSLALAPTPPPPSVEESKGPDALAQNIQRRLAPHSHLQVVSSRENGQPIMLPAYDADELEKLGPLPQPQLPDEVVQHFRDQGIQVEQQSHLYQMQNSENRKLVVPVNTIQFRQPLQ